MRSLFWNIKDKEENIAWMTAIELIQKNPVVTENLKIGIIVDSDLGNIDRYNNRESPIYGNFYLPANMHLVYASTDGGKEYAANRLISLADKESSKLLTVLAASGG